MVSKFNFNDLNVSRGIGSIRKTFNKGSSGKKKAARNFKIWLIITLSMLGVIFFMQFFSPYDPYQIDVKNIMSGPSAEHLLGTDYLGRDLLSRLMVGGTRSVFTAILVVIINAIVGTLIGIISGYVGGKADLIVMRITDMFQAFPRLVFTIAIAAMLGGGLGWSVLAICTVGWTPYARLARAQALSLKERTFVNAARVTGQSRPAVLFKTILPNALTPLIVEASMDVGRVILEFAGLSFLGLGTARPYPEWGSMLNDAQTSFMIVPHTALVPGIAILIVVVIVGIFGDSVNEYLSSKED